MGWQGGSAKKKVRFYYESCKYYGSGYFGFAVCCDFSRFDFAECRDFVGGSPTGEG